MKKELDKFKNYIKGDTIKALHPKAFVETFEIIEKFVEQGSNILKNSKNDEMLKSLSWVCDSRPGYGKTTALIAELEIIAEQNRKIPFLLVFNNNDTMGNVYRQVRDFGKSNGINNLILKIDTDNFKEEQHALTDFQFLCITQQRLRDIVLDKKFKQYCNYQPKEIGNSNKDVYTRLVIIDEMPILFDTAVFDLSSKDNSVDWFDKLANKSSLTPLEKRLCRNCIMLMITHELFRQGRVTKRLIGHIEKTDLATPFIAAMSKLSESASDLESSRKFRGLRNCLMKMA